MPTGDTFELVVLVPVSETTEGVERYERTAAKPFPKTTLTTIDRLVPFVLPTVVVTTKIQSFLRTLHHTLGTILVVQCTLSTSLSTTHSSCGTLELRTHTAHTIFACLAITC